MLASKGEIVLNKKGNCDKIVKKECVLEIDIMNRNTIISLAMLYAVWQTKHKDVLDLLRPFVLYAVGTTTKIKNRIDIDVICGCMEKEFGYSSFPQAIVTRILQREAVDVDAASKKNIVKMNCTPLVRQYDIILSNKWGVLLCQKEYQTNDIRRNSKNW